MQRFESCRPLQSLWGMSWLREYNSRRWRALIGLGPARFILAWFRQILGYLKEIGRDRNAIRKFESCRPSHQSGLCGLEVPSLFAISSPSVHSCQRPENIKNLSPVVTSRRESKRANAHRDCSHLVLRKPATSPPVDGRYAGHRFSSAMHGRRIIIQTLHPAPELARIIPPQELSHLVWRQRWAIIA